MKEAQFLKKIIQSDEKILDNRQKMKGLIADYFPGDNLLVNILVGAFDSGITRDLLSGKFDDFTWNKHMQYLVNNNGLSTENAERAIAIWVEAFDSSYIRCLPERKASKSKPATFNPIPAAPSKSYNNGFAAASVESARIYYDYLAGKGRGVVSCAVTHKEKIQTDAEILYVLYLDKHPGNLDSLQVRINGVDYSQSDLKPIEYDKAKRTLRVKPTAKFLQNIDLAQPLQISVVSDVKFLIKKVENWYRLYGNEVHLPTTRPAVALSDCSRLKRKPLPDQSEAVKASLENPFTYIWGAPGTGKTQFVLARCVLAYIQAGKRVLVTAPTNNAVEQTLYGLLPELKQAGYDPRGLVVRIGVPSADFAGRYPSVCENAAYAKLVGELSDNIVATKKQIKKYNELISLFDMREQDKKQLRFIADCAPQVSKIFAQIDHLYKETNSIQGKLLSLKDERSALEQRKTDLDTEIQKLKKDIEFQLTEANKFSTGLRKAFKPNKEAECRKQAEDQQLILTEDENSIIEVKDKIGNLDIQCQELEKKINDIYEWEKELRNDAKETAVNWGGVASLAESKEPDLGVRLSSLIEKEKKAINERQASYEAIQSYSRDQLASMKAESSDLLQRYENQKKKLDEGNASADVNKCKVLAATLDTCFSRIKPDDGFDIAHIFLDEAGYCPLIKGATLTAFSCPVTMLGDHMQLPPICEIDESELKTPKYELAVLWAQSALFIPEAMQRPVRSIIDGYLYNKVPSFEGLAKRSLVHTYRFGKTLASVLAGVVYDKDFYGSDQHDTDIFFIHAQRKESGKTRISIRECELITQYVAGHPNEDIGIIAPYNDQVRTIKGALYKAGLKSDNVFTVHKAQGREWDTVLFSVTDTVYKFFTDSTSRKSNGKNVINTAVSRAKSRLIIVCDYDYWSQEEKQLIAKLLKVASEIREVEMNPQFKHASVGNPNEYLQLAEKYYKDENLYSVVDIYNRAINQYWLLDLPEKLFILAANSYCDMGNFKKAEEATNMALRKRGDRDSYEINALYTRIRAKK